MIRNYKAFALAFAAMFALGAIVAQGASATPLTVGTSAPTVFITGDQDGGTHTFTTPNGNVQCTNTSFSGSGANTEGKGLVKEITVTPDYTSCKAFGIATAHVTHNGCTYTFTTPSTLLKTGEVKWDPNDLHIECPAGKSIQITPTVFGVSSCTQSVGPQTVTGGHVIGRNAGTNDITLEITLSGIHYTGTGGVCGNSETHSDATYVGSSTVKCFSDSAHTNQISCTFS